MIDRLYCVVQLPHERTKVPKFCTANWETTTGWMDFSRGDGMVRPQGVVTTGRGAAAMPLPMK
jgi:hypothetical protein